MKLKNYVEKQENEIIIIFILMYLERVIKEDTCMYRERKKKHI